ncbi:PREDICTED: uncharacterized protein At4g02000-like [Camelina sativa]|uniref:Uncharacterized protein At4g02000-like n=1 Tax=Camelina sativa TaxID=90675 RepID=A0ABM1QNF1_CAMSA|nr:PREDICTED: uncharacterized protein At4g02000-like [Camelina sativa]
MVSVLRQQPWLVNDLFVALQRWEDFPGEEFLTFIDLWVQLRGIPLPYVYERTVRYIANTIGDVVELYFNEDTTPQIAFLRVKVRIIFTDRLCFFRRVRFQSGERAMVGLEYEKLIKICKNCSRINHHSRSCPFLVPPVAPVEEDDELLVPVWEEGQHSHTPSRGTDKQSTESSDISTYSPISQPPRHPSPLHNGIQAVGEQPVHNMFATNPKGKQESTGSNFVRDSHVNHRFDVGESSKRKKGKQIASEQERNTRPRRKDMGVKFYTVPSEPP